MSFKYETHLHTRIASACGKSKGSEYISYYKSMGYDGIFVTDHFYHGNTCVDRSLSWPEWVRGYCASYREAKEEGDRQGLKVFFGWEISYDAEDFLIYGLSEDWLVSHPEVLSWNQAEQYENIRAAGGLVVQAHPFRERDYMTEIKLHPHHADAWEVANAGNEPYQNRLAYDYAVAHGITMTAGSDIHRVGSTGYGCVFGMVTEEPLESEQDYVKLIKSGKGFSLNVPDGVFLVPEKRPYFPVYEFDENHCRVKRYY